MALPKVHIQIEGPRSGFVEVDGQRLRGVHGIAVEYDTGNPARVTVEMWADVEVTGAAEITLVAQDPRAAPTTDETTTEQTVDLEITLDDAAIKSIATRVLELLGKQQGRR